MIVTEVDSRPAPPAGTVHVSERCFRKKVFLLSPKFSCSKFQLRRISGTLRRCRRSRSEDQLSADTFPAQLLSSTFMSGQVRLRFPPSALLSARYSPIINQSLYEDSSLRRALLRQRLRLQS